ncbi:hypothetical protein THALO_50009 [Tenacibaculum halocynthiae]
MILLSLFSKKTTKEFNQNLMFIIRLTKCTFSKKGHKTTVIDIIIKIFKGRTLFYLIRFISGILVNRC